MPKIKLIAAVSLAIMSLTASLPACAALGGRASSIEMDRRQLKALSAPAVREMVAYSVHDFNLSDGTLTREYVNGNGVVFAVSWNGPQRPNLKQLFGDYFPRFQAANVQTGKVRMRHALAVSAADFVVRSGGHSGASWGYALLPRQMPESFDADALVRGTQ